MVTLEQCDLQRTVMLNPAVKRFRVQEAVGAGADRRATASRRASGAGERAHGDGRHGPGIRGTDGLASRTAAWSR